MKRSWGERVLGARSWDFGQSYKTGEILRLSGLGFLGMGGAVLPMRFRRFRGGSEGWLARGGLTHGIPWVKGEGPRNRGGGGLTHGVPWVSQILGPEHGSQGKGGIKGGFIITVE